MNNEKRKDKKGQYLWIAFIMRKTRNIEIIILINGTEKRAKIMK